MAENKTSFLAYADWQGMFNALPDDIAGKLVKHLFAYVNDENPESDNYIITALFEPIKATLKRDLKKWDESVTEKSNNGKLGNLKRYNPDLFEQVKSEKLTIEEAENIALSRKVSHSDVQRSQPVANLAVSDSVNVSVSVSDSVLKKEDDVDEIITPSPTFNFFTLKNFEDFEIEHGSQFSIYAYKQTGKLKDELDILKKEFLDTQIAISKLPWKDEADAKTHFLNWIKKQPPKQSVSSKPKETTLQKHARRQREQNGTA